MSIQAFCSDTSLNLVRYRHAADKLKKTENVMEKYKKKLEESADVRRELKVACDISSI